MERIGNYDSLFNVDNEGGLEQCAWSAHSSSLAESRTKKGEIGDVKSRIRLRRMIAKNM